MRHIWSGFGYELWFDNTEPIAQYKVLEGDGSIVAQFETTFEAKKWMKEHKTSVCWCADGTWDWSRLED